MVVYTLFPVALSHYDGGGGDMVVVYTLFPVTLSLYDGVDEQMKMNNQNF